MTAKNLWLVSLSLAGLLECGMAITHFGLQYEWSALRDFGTLPPQLAWALFALNFSWSVLLLGVGGLVLYAASLGSAGAFTRSAIFTVGLFWAIHGAYIWLKPMPLPARLAWLAFPIAAFPAVLVVLHWIPLAVTNAAQATVARARVPRQSPGDRSGPISHGVKSF